MISLFKSNKSPFPCSMGSKKSPDIFSPPFFLFPKLKKKKKKNVGKNGFLLVNEKALLTISQQCIYTVYDVGAY